MYLNYEEYAALNGSASKAEFPILEFKMRKVLDYLTDSRIQKMAKVPEAVKMCMVSMIDIESNVGVDAQVKNPQVSSFSTDGYTESYAKPMDAAEASQAEIDVIKAMLWGETDDEGMPLLYRGLY